jgi:ubiquinone/menaquinone biosynthesis C-methylase UbiE
MSTYVLMRVLESAPRRYELGMRLLTLGRLDRVYDRLAGYVEPEQRVLDVGCGTGSLSVRAARRGAMVRGIDVSPEMLAMARDRVREEHLEDEIELVEMGVAELDAEPADAYDAVTSGLCLSELSEDEVSYCLDQIARVLRPGGQLLIADEVRPRNPVARVLRALIRAPLVILTYLITQQTTHALAKLPERVAAAGLSPTTVTRSRIGGLGLCVAAKPGGAPS